MDKDKSPAFFSKEDEDEEGEHEEIDKYFESYLADEIVGRKQEDKKKDSSENPGRFVNALDEVFPSLFGKSESEDKKSTTASEEPVPEQKTEATPDVIQPVVEPSVREPSESIPEESRKSPDENIQATIIEESPKSKSETLDSGKIKEEVISIKREEEAPKVTQQSNEQAGSVSKAEIEQPEQLIDTQKEKPIDPVEAARQAVDSSLNKEIIDQAQVPETEKDESDEAHTTQKVKGKSSVEDKEEIKDEFVRSEIEPEPLNKEDDDENIETDIQTTETPESYKEEVNEKLQSPATSEINPDVYGFQEKGFREAAEVRGTKEAATVEISPEPIEKVLAEKQETLIRNRKKQRENSLHSSSYAPETKSRSEDIFDHQAKSTTSQEPSNISKARRRFLNTSSVTAVQAIVIGFTIAIIILMIVAALSIF